MIECNIICNQFSECISMTMTPYWAVVAQEQMKKKKIYQKDLVDIFEVKSASAVSHYFSGRNKITSDQITALAEYLDINVAKLLDDNAANAANGLDVDSLIEALQALVRMDKLPDSEIISLFNTLEKLDFKRIAEVYNIYTEANKQKEEKISSVIRKLTN